MKRPLLAAVLFGAFAAPAHAADHQFGLSAAANAFTWEGASDLSHGPPLYNEPSRTAIPCDSGPLRPCEEVLFKVEEAGKFTASVEGLEGTGGTTDVDAYLYKSDESGAQGEHLATAAASGPDSVTAAKAAPGFYLLVVDYYHGYNSGYAGKVKFTPSAPPAVAVPVVTPPAVPAAAAAPAKPSAKQKLAAKKKSCARKARKIKSAKKRKAALKRCAKLKK